MMAEPSHSTQDKNIADENWTEFGKTDRDRKRCTEKLALGNPYEVVNELPTEISIYILCNTSKSYYVDNSAYTPICIVQRIRGYIAPLQ
jgi:hypothetical protein